ncbi:MAG: LamG-like jellyroll fold domain-containing protein [Bacteroidota bacterium]|jgi:hypothetical protein
MKHVFTALLLFILATSPGMARYNDNNLVLNVSGGSYISVPNAASLNNQLVLGLRFTIDAWVKPASTGSEMAIVGNGFAYRFGLDASGKLQLKINNQQIFTGTGIIPTTAWTHVAVALDIPAGYIRFFINGALDRDIFNTGSLSGNTGVFCIGADIGGSVAPIVVTPWNGAIDEVRVWKTAIDFRTALGALTNSCHAVHWGQYGQYLVSAWRLNGSGTDFCGGNHGTPVGSCTYSGTSLPPFYDRIGLAFQNHFATGGPGLSVVTIPHSTTLNLTSSYTVEFWMKPSSLIGHPSLQTLVCKGSGQAGTWSFWIGLNKTNGKIRFVPRGDWSTYMESSTAVPINQWSHVGVTFFPTGQNYTAIIVINGNSSGIATYSSPTPSNSHDVLLGSASTSASANIVYGYSGILDEVRIWNGARSYDQIADNHRIEMTGAQPGLAASYRFDGDLSDKSGNGNHSSYLITESMNYFVSTTDLPGPPSLSITAPTAGTVWNAGETHNILYQAVGLPSVRLELSRDGGATFGETLIQASSGPFGYFIWPVTGPASTQCRIRATTPSPTPFADTSDIFTVADNLPVLNVDPIQVQFIAQKNAPLPPSIPLHIWNSGTGTLSWTITTSSPAWLSIPSLSGSGNDQNVDLAVTTTDMFAGVYTETLIINSNATNGPIFVLVTYRVTTAGLWEVRGRVTRTGAAGVAGVPVHAEGPISQLSWTGQDGYYEFTNLPGGNYVITPASLYYDFDPVQRSFTPLNNNENGVDFLLSQKNASIMFHYVEGWNLVSVPANIGYQAVTSVFPDAVPPAYLFDPDSGYVARNMIEHSYAYWIRFSRTDSVAVTGTMFRLGGQTALDKVSGWNTLAMTSGDVLIDSITQSAPGVLLRVYEYDPLLGYVLPAGGLLRSGKGYFVKLKAPGYIEFLSMEDESIPPVPPPSPALRSIMNIPDEDMPPQPPGGIPIRGTGPTLR